MVELLVVIAIIGVLIALLLPAVQAAREAARRMKCANNLKQVSLAVHLFHDVHQRFPAYVGDPLAVMSRRNHFFVMLPFIEQQAMYDACIQSGVTPYSGDNGQVQRPISSFLCPSDSVANTWSSNWNENGVIKNSYCGSLADLPGFITTTAVAANMSPHPRSWLQSVLRMRDFSSVTDGTSNSIMHSEHLLNDNMDSAARGGNYRRRAALIATGGGYWNYPDDCLSLKGPNGDYLSSSQNIACRFGAGLRAFDCHHPITCFHPILPPNSPSCLHTDLNNINQGIVSATSLHNGGVNVAFIDGSVSFINETIETKNLHQRQTVQTPYLTYVPTPQALTFGLWAELGTICGDEPVTKP